jgi:hypothetical protein
MKSLANGARRLPTHHITIRVPWHDSGWTGSVCAHPLENTSCLILPRIGEGKRDESEVRCAQKRLDELSVSDLPPCVGGARLVHAPFDLPRVMHHPYTETSPDAWPLCTDALRAACVLCCQCTIQMDASQASRRGSKEW